MIPQRSGIELAPLPPIAAAIRPPRSVDPSRQRHIRALRFETGPPDIINAKSARELGNVTGNGIVVAVLDSGCNPHEALTVSLGNPASRVLPGVNFTGVGAVDNVSDTLGHGTAIAALVAGCDLVPVVAPGAQILPLKVNAGPGASDLSFVDAALSWLLTDPSAQNVSLVVLSMGDVGNYQTVAGIPNTGGGIRQQIAQHIGALATRNIPTVTAAGNGYFSDGQTIGPGMCFPAIMPACISVGAVFNAALPETHFPQYGETWIASASDGQIAPFSQRMPHGAGAHFTRLMAPGGPLQSASNIDPTDLTRPAFGTSLSAPLVAGVVCLMQEWHVANRGGLPTCEQIQAWLMLGASDNVDAASNDNVLHTGAVFKQVDALGALQAMID